MLKKSKVQCESYDINDMTEKWVTIYAHSKLSPFLFNNGSFDRY
jgi:hypothetical protein